MNLPSHFIPTQFYLINKFSLFSVANSPTLSMHNFSFRNDPLNAPKGQEIIHAFDEAVEIFPAKIQAAKISKIDTDKLIQHRHEAKQKHKSEQKNIEHQHKTPERKIVDKPAPPERKLIESTSLSPSLPSGLLKVKMFGKMKEKNTFGSPPTSGPESSSTSNNEPKSADESMEIDDDEDFELEATPSNRTQSLGNSGVTITPIRDELTFRQDIKYAINLIFYLIKF